MLRQTNYGLCVDDDGKSNKNELAIDYIVESARSVGIEVIEGKTALDIQFMAEVMKRLREKQEPCEDCISRAELLKAMDTWDKFGYRCAKYEKLDSVTEKYFVPYIHYDDVVKAIKGMPSIQPKTDVLDKIRAEIEQLTYYWCEVNPRTVIDDVLNIIDKYKAESEDKE